MFQNSTVMISGINKKNKSSDYYRLVNILLFLFVIFAVFMPADNLNLKKIFFVFTVIVSMPIAKKRMWLKKNRFLFFMTIIFPSLEIMLSISVFSNNVVNAVKIGHCAIYFFLFFIVCDIKVKYFEIFIKILKMEAIVIILFTVMHFTGIFQGAYGQITHYLWATGNAMIGIDNKAVLGVLFFLKTSPLLVLLLGWAAHTKNDKWVVIGTISLICSGTRANSLCGLAMCVGYFLLKQEKSRIKKMIRGGIFFIIIWLVLLVFLPNIVNFITNLQANKVDNDLWRTSILSDVLNLFRDNPLSLLVGTGMGSPIYATLYGQYVSILEISYFDMLRQVGLVGFIPFCYFILKPIKKLGQINIWIALSYCAYLAIGFTNPLLYSSTGYLAYVYIYLFIEREGIIDTFRKCHRKIKFKF